VIQPFLIEEPLLKFLELRPTSDNLRAALNSSRVCREEITRLWLTEGVPVAFCKCPIAYEKMRTWLGLRLDVCPKEITLLGSARLGFSLAKPKYGRPFDSVSDLDISVVSEQIFQQLSEVFHSWRRDYSQGTVSPRNDRERAYWDENLSFFKRNLPYGFIDSAKLPTFNRYPLVQKIQNAMWELTKKLETTPGVPSPKKASVRVYCSWKDLVSRVSFNLYMAMKFKGMDE